MTRWTMLGAMPAGYRLAEDGHWFRRWRRNRRYQQSQWCLDHQSQQFGTEEADHGATMSPKTGCWRRRRRSR